MLFFTTKCLDLFNTGSPLRCFEQSDNVKIVDFQILSRTIIVARSIITWSTKQIKIILGKNCANGIELHVQTNKRNRLSLIYSWMPKFLPVLNEHHECKNTRLGLIHDIEKIPFVLSSYNDVLVGFQINDWLI